MHGHAVSNVIPVVAANRIGSSLDGYPAAASASTARPSSPTIAATWSPSSAATTRASLVATFDLDFLAAHRAAWGFFRDRRPELYGALDQRRGRRDRDRAADPARLDARPTAPPFVAMSADPAVMDTLGRRAERRAERWA